MNTSFQDDRASLFTMYTIQNIMNIPFEIKYNSSDPRNGYYYVMEPQEVIDVPYFIAKHAVKHMTDIVLNQYDIPTSQIDKRKKLEELIVLSVKGNAMPVMKTPQQQAIESSMQNNRVRSQSRDIRTGHDLGSVLSGRGGVARPPTQIGSEGVEVSENVKQPAIDTRDEVFEGNTPQPTSEIDSKISDALSDYKEESDGVVLTPQNTPTREQLYAHAARVNGITITEDAKKKLDEISVETLVKELDYPVTEVNPVNTQ